MTPALGTWDTNTVQGSAVSEQSGSQPEEATLNRLLLITLFSAVAFQGASALDPDGRWSNSPHRTWFGQQHDANGKWCCDESDGHLFDGNYSLNKDGSVTIHAATGDIQVEPHKVIMNTKNPTGTAVWWYRSMSTAGTYCFAPGALL